MSKPAEPSLIQNKVQLLNANRARRSLDLVVKMSWGLILQICVIIALSLHCSLLAWSIALRTQELHTRPRVLKQRWLEERIGSSFLNVFQTVLTRTVVESSQPPPAEHVLGSKGSYHLQLVRCDLDFPFDQGACSSLAPCTSVIRVLCQTLEPIAFIVHPCLQPLQKMLLLPFPVRQTAHENWPELCRRSRPVPQIMIFVFPAFTLSPFSSIDSILVKSLLTHSSRDSAMITRSSA